MFSSFYLVCRGKDNEETEHLNRSETATFIDEYITTSIRRFSFDELDFQSKIKETKTTKKKLYTLQTL